jgi:HK97 family phage prohead protease
MAAWDEAKHPRDPTGEWTHGTHALPAGHSREKALRGHLIEQHGARTSMASSPHLQESDLAGWHQGEHGKKNAAGIVSEQQVEDSHSIDAAGHIVHKHTARRAATVTHEKVGHTNQGLWHHKGMQLPAYVQHVANDLIESGHPESEAVQMAIGIIKNWAHGGGGNVTAETRAKAVAALAEWERLKVQAKASRGAWNSAAHPRAPAGGPTGGQFSAGSGSGKNAAPTPGNANPVGPGETGKRVSDLQARLNEFGAKLKADGKFGPGTLAAVKAFQQAHGLKVDGLVGPKTTAALRTKTPAAKPAAKKAGIQVADDNSSTATAARAGFGEYRRIWDLEDIHIVRTAQGDSSGRLVEAYAAAFGQRAEIHDPQGHYEEENDPGAFNDELAKINRSRAGLASVKVMFNHAMTIHGTPSSLDSVPVAVPEYIAPESRGLLTRARYLNTTRAEEVLEAIKAGAITAQSYTGRIYRSSPELPGPGARYRKRGGALQLVRRLALGLKEFGPTPFPAFTGAEIMGVRMQLPDGSGEDLARYDTDMDEPEDEEFAPDLDGDGTGGTPEDVTSARYHQHALWRLQLQETLEKKGLAL